ncbi:MAG: ATP-dependent Clp protease proteolytic subunit [Candidatus Hydrogenedentes bacterium]|nr:ATP-dependent Clp protease proteolytic subunit [Candidatus Hydrogenedentota bacterium]
MMNQRPAIRTSKVLLHSRLVRGMCLSFLALFVASPTALQAQSEDPFVVICPIRSEIHDGVSVLVTRAVEKAWNAQAIIFILDTPGGRLDSALNIVDTILKAPCKTIAFVDGMGAISAGALISYACDEIIMSPTTNIGASQVVYMSEEGMMPAGEKETSFLRAKYAALGEEKGHNPDIGMAMVDKDIELIAIPRGDGKFDVRATTPSEKSSSGETSAVEKVIDSLSEATGTPLEPLKDLARDITEGVTTQETPEVQPEEATPLQGEIIDTADKLLTLTPQQAVMYGLIKQTAHNIEEVKAAYSLEGARNIEIDMSWSESFFGWLASPGVAGILLLLGVGGIYLEMKTPGFGLPGVVGIVCLTLFFGSRYMIGMADWLDIALVIIGVCLVLVEIFFIPGFGLVGGIGIICVAAGLIMSLTFTDFTLPQYSWEFARLRDAGMTVTIAFVTMTLFVILSWKYLPQTPLYRRIVMGAELTPEKGYTVQSPAESEEYVGLRGVATSMLRPAGRARFGDQTLLVVCNAEFIEAGTPIEIIEVNGNRYVVDRIREDA